jgi:acetoin utilization deacetylase AcuC-like enzyme/formylglycine-generating enzyme required for sulfatase activity/Tol biopolymer transport system component
LQDLNVPRNDQIRHKRRNYVSQGITFALNAALALAGSVLLVSCGDRPTGSAAAADAVIKPPSGGELILIPAGEFTMGQPGGRADETPHAVSVASFYMDRCPVTQELYERIAGSNPSKRKGLQNPVERVQWIDAARYCNACSERDGLAPCYDPQTWECRFEASGYRLPTEAEWEYACRAGSRTRYFFGDDASKASQHAWFKPHSAGMAHPVGQKRPNAWGLHDMLGNVWEWCNDWYGEGSYAESPRDKPRGPISGKQRVLRGGAWDCGPEKCTAAYRSKEFPVFTDACFGADTYGFRRVRSNGSGAASRAGEPQTNASTDRNAKASRSEDPQTKPTASPPAQPGSGAASRAGEPQTNASGAPVQPGSGAASRAGEPQTNASGAPVQPGSGAASRAGEPQTNASGAPAQPGSGAASRAGLLSPTGKLALSQLTGTIIFVSDRSGTLKIWSMRADGKPAARGAAIIEGVTETLNAQRSTFNAQVTDEDPRPLTQGPDPDADPRFSPDGKRILYTTLRNGFPEVWTMQRDGSAPQKVTSGSQSDWSPDGRQIVFIRDNQAWVRELASAQERRVSPEAWERCGVPAWRPDGKALALASRHTGAIGIYFLSPDGKESSPLATEEPSCTPRWSKDSSRLLCQTVKGHVHQVSADGKDWEQVTFGADLQHDARYSPDGSLIVFCRAPSSEGPWQLCVSRLGGDDMDFIPLTTEGSNFAPDWSADDRQPAPAPRKEVNMQPNETTKAPLPTAFLYDPLFLEHKVGESHPERPQRLEAILARLKEKGLTDKLLALKAAPAEEKRLTAVHSREYVERVKKACSECGDGISFIDTPDVPVSARSYDAAVLAAGGVLAAVDAVAGGKARNAFCAVRPPGHHALKEKAMGFCLFGNVAIAARYIQQKHKLAKVLIVDWDVHHGNGTQAASYDDPTILHFDVHRSPFYPGSGRADETGAGKGAGFKINVPLPAGSSDKDYREAFENKLKPAALAFRPDFVLVSAGFDAHENDPLGGMKLTAEGYAELTRIVKGIAETCCRGRLVSVLEGGYDLDGLADSVEAHIRALMES